MERYKDQNWLERGALIQNGVGAWSASGKIRWSAERQIFFLGRSVQRSVDQNWLECRAVTGIAAKCGPLNEKENHFYQDLLVFFFCDRIKAKIKWSVECSIE